jgi:hypothetical protein
MKRTFNEWKQFLHVVFRRLTFNEWKQFLHVVFRRLTFNEWKQFLHVVFRRPTSMNGNNFCMWFPTTDCQWMETIYARGLETSEFQWLETISTRGFYWLGNRITCRDITWPAVSHWQTLSYNSVSSTPHPHVRESNTQLKCWYKKIRFNWKMCF